MNTNIGAGCLDLDFIAGFIDADGSLLLGLEKSPTSNTKYTPKLILDITNSDRLVLELVKNTLGFGFLVQTSSTTYAYRTNTHTDAKKIVKLFENRVHGSAKIEMPLWKQALELVTTKQTRSFQGISKFVHLMYAINTKGKLRTKPITDWLTLFGQPYLPDYGTSLICLSEGKTSPKGKGPHDTIPSIASWYISGYCQGDGSFNLSNKQRFQSNFRLTDAYKPILVSIQKTLLPNLNCVFEFDPKTSENNQKCYRLQITRFQVIQKHILPHFDKFPVYGLQKKRYDIWCQAVLLYCPPFIEKSIQKSKKDALCALFVTLKEKVS
jgi:hypothetical protein